MPGCKYQVITLIEPMIYSYYAWNTYLTYDWARSKGLLYSYIAPPLSLRFSRFFSRYMLFAAFFGGRTIRAPMSDTFLRGRFFSASAGFSAKSMRACARAREISCRRKNDEKAPSEGGTTRFRKNEGSPKDEPWKISGFLEKWYWIGGLKRKNPENPWAPPGPLKNLILLIFVDFSKNWRFTF